VNHYYAGIHFKPLETGPDEWFHIHVILETPDETFPLLVENWPHGAVEPPHEYGISAKKAADYITGYAIDPLYDWPDWFRKSYFKRFTCSKGFRSLDPQHTKQKSSRKQKTGSHRTRRRRDPDQRIAECGQHATITVTRPGERGGQVDLVIGNLKDLELVKSVLNGKSQFSEQDLLNPNRGESPEDFYRQTYGWTLPNLPVGYMSLVPEKVIAEYQQREHIVAELSRLIGTTD
jgi:hypothetical protein